MNKNDLIKILEEQGQSAVAETVAEQVADNFSRASNDVVGVICDALRTNKDLIPSDAIKLMNVMKKRDLKEIESILANATDKSIEEIDSLLEVLAQDNDNFARALFEYRGKEPTSYLDDDMLKAILDESAKSMREDMINISRTSAITVAGNDIKMDKAYTKIVNQGIFATQQGYTDFNTAVRQVVRTMAANGVRSVYFSNGMKRRVDSQARMNVLEGIKRFNSAYRREKGKQYGADGVEIDLHFPCAPDHLPYQGKQFSYEEYEKLQNRLTRPIGSMNCRHSDTPIILGISEPAYSQEEIEEAKRESEKQVSYTDSRGVKRTCSGYEATQVQRRMETKIRRLKDQQSSLKRIGDDMGAREVGKQVTRAKKEYYRVSDELGLRARDNRLGGAVRTLKANDKNDIMKLEEALKKCKTGNEVGQVASDYFKHKKGCSIEDVDFNNIDVDAAKQMTFKLDDLDNRFNSSLRTIKSGDYGDEFNGVCTPRNSSLNKYIDNGFKSNDLESDIALNNRYLKNKKVIKDDFNMFNRPDGSGYADNPMVKEEYAAIVTLVHEYGHSLLPGKLNEVLAEKGYVNPSLMTARKVYNSYIRNLNNLKSEIQKVRESFAGQEDGLRKGIEAAKELQAEYDALCISKYSTETLGEFIAEAFCDYELSENPREYSKKVHDMLVKMCGRGVGND